MLKNLAMKYFGVFKKFEGFSFHWVFVLNQLIGLYRFSS